MRIHRGHRALVGATAVVVTAGIVLGAGIATASTESGPLPAARVAGPPADLPRAFEGLSYGPPASVGTAEDPELIAALSSEGRLGYVKRDELRRAQGHPSLFQSPEEALAWQASMAGKTPSVDVYDLDGTVIGEFVMGNSTTIEVSGR